MDSVAKFCPQRSGRTDSAADCFVSAKEACVTDPPPPRRKDAPVVPLRRGYASAEVSELVRLTVARDCDAFEELMGRYRAMICGLCGRMARTDEDAADAVQAVQWAVWQKIHTYEGRSQFSTWLHTLTFRTTLGLLRKRYPEPDEDIDEFLGSESPQEVVADLVALRWALAQLKPEFREALLMRVCDGLSLEEIAEIQIVAVGTVKSRLSRARGELSILLKDRD
jgi:RNA polymerase sigma factor (sigma-70 family)